MRAGNMFEESEQKAEQGQSTKWILLEDSKYRLYWDFVIALLIVFYMFVVPLRLAFATTCEDDAFAQGQQGWFWLDLTADIFFMIDIGLNFRTGYREPGGGLVTSPKQIAVHYLGGWFIIDLTASVPLSLLVLATEGASRRPPPRSFFFAASAPTAASSIATLSPPYNHPRTPRPRPHTHPLSHPRPWRRRRHRRRGCAHQRQQGAALRALRQAHQARANR